MTLRNPITANPIMARELKERMRTLRVPIVLSFYLMILGLIVFALERAIARTSDFGAFSSALAGRQVFHWLLFFLLMFICFMVPAFTAGAISSERERQTFHLVQVSLLSPRQIVLGKLGAASLYLVLLIVATLPLVSVSFVLGGVTPLDVVRGYGMVLFTGLTISLAGIAISSRLRRTLGATVLTFLLVAGLTAGTAIAYGLVRSAQNRDAFLNGAVEQPAEPIWTFYLNPFIGTASAIQGEDTGGGDTPFEAIFAFIDHANEQRLNPVSVGPPSISPVPPSIPVPPPVVATPNRGTVPVWVWTIVLYSIIGLGSFVVAFAGVRAPKTVFRTGRSRRRGALEGG